MHIIELEPTEVELIKAVVNSLAEKYSNVEDESFLIEATTYAQEFPRRLRDEINRFRLLETGNGLFLIKGFPREDLDIVETPSHWKDKPEKSKTIHQDIYFFLCSCLLADPVGWATQQEGYILHDILPVKGYEQEQLGAGSEVLLTWHTEDAFHPYRTDYLGLMCMRNPDNVETTYASIDDINIDRDLKEKLLENHYVIRPDESHLEKNRGKLRKEIAVSEDVIQRSYARINKMDKSPEKISVLFGDPEKPYLRLDPYFMDDNITDSKAKEAFDTIVREVDENIKGYALQPGEIIFLDNYKVVHGRNPFKARFDGTDRWLKRLNIARDIRKSRDSRIKPESRIIF
ncbi:enduracididine beta-hydroxylase [Cytobacillus horneckiae]|uniref:guanitoxin biosynthesis L-enduracididine beta-hydroxylase GntD n=1 Tax=Cytobacillus horneckiae TaxID=549687 RepID=UPI0015629F83|nr:guanitoxin biosynthesis L-enduracididine beta-hydroxylase GntD [Cytobacillus horneckiae]MBN6889309.1 TauD/TfdA family dioxygenase [Cytobacillus horneckiae]NRG43277.1 TauD/TfdA family dioxygenase [Bacillus sp. CRN 9]